MKVVLSQVLKSCKKLLISVKIRVTIFLNIAKGVSYIALIHTLPAINKRLLSYEIHIQNQSDYQLSFVMFSI